MTVEALFPEPGRAVPPTAVHDACARTVAALGELGLIEDHHAGTVALVLSLADSIDALGHYGTARKGTPLALLARELREALATLPEPPVAIDSGWEELANELREAASRHPG